MTNEVKVEVNDLYRLLISDCRYGYTRNNHLMPDGAYTNAKKYLDLMFEADKGFALYTACQLCDECISQQLQWNFSDALDDEFHNRKDAIDFINYLLDWIHEKGKDVTASLPDYTTFYPPNYNVFKDNLAREENLRYRVFELDAFDRDANRVRELTTAPVSKKEADKVLFTDELCTNTCVMNHIDIRTREEYPIRNIGEIIRIIEPESHKNKVYSIELVREEK